MARLQGVKVLALLSLGAALVIPDAIDGQTLLRRGEEVPQIQFDPVVTFGETEGPGYIGLPGFVVHRQSGEWVVTDQINQSEIKFYSENGEWIRTIGRTGEGPGEFQWAMLVHVEPDDGLRVFDPQLGRVTDLSPSLEVTGTMKIQNPWGGLTFLPNGRLVIAAHLNGPDQIGLPLHLIDSEGNIARSFGADPPIRDWGNPFKSSRGAVPSGGGAVWSAHRTEYAIERWTVEGIRTHYFSGDVPWFEPQERFGKGPDPAEPPHPGLYVLHSDEEGLVWLAFRVPDPNWENALETVSGPGGRNRQVSRDDNLLYDTIIEVVDPTRGEVVATGRHSAAAWAFTNEGDLVFHRLKDDGTPVCEIWKVRF